MEKCFDVLNMLCFVDECCDYGASDVVVTMVVAMVIRGGGDGVDLN